MSETELVMSKFTQLCWMESYLTTVSLCCCYNWTHWQ